MRHALWKASLLALVPLLPSAALAQGDANRAAAVALYDDAEKLMAAGNYAAACPKYAESNRLDPQLGALVHLADCYEKNGQTASAWARWRDAVDIAARTNDPRGDVARKRAAALQPKLSKLVIQVPPASDVTGLEVRRDGAQVSRSLWGSSVPVDAGKHVVEASAPGKKKLVAEVVVGANAASVEFSLPLLEDDATGSEAAAASAAVSEAPTGPAGQRDTITAAADPGATQRTLGWIAGGVGVVGIGAGVFFELQRSSKVKDRDDICPSGKNCTPEEATKINGLNDDVDSAASLETVSFVAGGILLAGGVVLLLTAPSSTPATTTSVNVTPVIGHGTYGLGAIGRF